MIQFLLGLSTGVMIGFVIGVATMAVAAANKTAQHLYDLPHIETHSEEISDL